MNIIGVRKIELMGYSQASLFPVTMGVEGASKEKIHILGGIILEVIATNPDTKQTLSTFQLFYVSTQVSQTYLSRDCCEQLQTLPTNSPQLDPVLPHPILHQHWLVCPDPLPPSHHVQMMEYQQSLTNLVIVHGAPCHTQTLHPCHVIQPQRTFQS